LKQSFFRGVAEFKGYSMSEFASVDEAAAHLTVLMARCSLGVPTGVTANVTVLPDMDTDTEANAAELMAHARKPLLVTAWQHSAQPPDYCIGMWPLEASPAYRDFASREAHVRSGLESLRARINTKQRHDKAFCVVPQQLEVSLEVFERWSYDYVFLEGGYTINPAAEGADHVWLLEFIGPPLGQVTGEGRDVE
jgi:hypothetical protein